jgi:outer membrane lipoprotein-sorting protein
MSATMTIIDVDGSKKAYDFTTHQKGDKMRLVRFTSGENKGLATLIEERNRVYVYLPGMKKVRRVAAHGMNQSFGGSDFSNDDMAAVSWVAWYDATLLKADDSHYYLNCTPKAGYDSAYSKAIVKVNRKTFHQDGIEYFNKAGEKVKTFENGSPREFAGGLRNSLVLVTDVRTGHKTRLDVHEFKANQGLPDSMFTQRELEWGR